MEKLHKINLYCNSTMEIIHQHNTLLVDLIDCMYHHVLKIVMVAILVTRQKIQQGLTCSTNDVVKGNRRCGLRSMRTSITYMCIRIW